MPHFLTHALIESATALPFLLVIYFVIEFVEYRFGSGLRAKVDRKSRLAPLAAALLGCVPQCGFSVVGASLYSRRLITTGTLLAIFLSTSDEAIPVILSQPGHAKVIAPLLAAKIVIAVAAGYAVDAVVTRREPAGTAPRVEELPACCGHHVGSGVSKRELIIHPLRHTAMVFLFLFLVSAGLGGAIEHLGEERLHALLLGSSLWQPVMAAAVGLIPNCAASVAITQLYIKGGIGFGSTIAGLSAGAGLGMLVLIKENRRRADTARIVALLFLISAAAGILVQSLYN